MSNEEQLLDSDKKENQEIEEILDSETTRMPDYTNVEAEARWYDRYNGWQILGIEDDFHVRYGRFGPAEKISEEDLKDLYA